MDAFDAVKWYLFQKEMNKKQWQTTTAKNNNSDNENESQWS